MAFGVAPGIALATTLLLDKPGDLQCGGRH